MRGERALLPLATNYDSLQNEHSHLKEELDTLVREHKDLNAEHDALHASNGRNARARAAAEAQHAKLTSSLEDLQGKYNITNRSLVSAQFQVGELGRKYKEARAQADEFVRNNQDLRNERDGLLQQVQRNARLLIGLKGPCKRVAFLFDISGSLQAEPFPEYQSLLTTWIEHLDFVAFNIISFSDSAMLWKPGWQQASPETRAAAAQHIAAFQAAGETATMQALNEAFDLPGLDTIVLFSDGQPSHITTATVLENVQRLNQQNVVINVVAIGDYFAQEYGTFLRTLAQEHGGVFIGR